MATNPVGAHSTVRRAFRPRLRERLERAWVPAAVAFLAIVDGLLAGYEPVLGIAFALGVAFAVLVFVDLTVGVAVMVVLAFLETLTDSAPIDLAKLAGALLVAAWVGLMATSQVRVRSFFAERPGLTWVVVLFLAWSAVSLLWADVLSEARTSVMRYTLNAVLIPIVYTAVRHPKHIIRLLVALLVGALFAGFSGITGGGADVERATGSVGDANELAAALVLSLGVAAAFALNRHLSSTLRLFGAVTAVVCVVGVLLSLSRGGLIGMGVAGVAAVVLAGRWRLPVGVGVGGVVLAGVGYFAFFASLPARERVTNVGGGGTGRLDLWTVAQRMIVDRPLEGVGTGQFQTSSVHYLLQPGAIERADFILSRPKVAHNTYLNVLAELGAVGGAFFFLIIGLSVFSLLRAAVVFGRIGDERMEIVLRGAAVGVAGYLVALLFISENYSKLFWLVIALGPAVLAVAREQEGAAAGGAAAREAPA